MRDYRIKVGKNADPNKGGAAGWEAEEYAVVTAEDAASARYAVLTLKLGWTQLSPPEAV